MREATRIGVLEGVRVGQNGVEVSLLQFADDTLFVCQPKYQSILAIKVILRSFKVVLSLKVNFYKSQVDAVGISDVDMIIFSKWLNCGSMYFSFKYLGISIGGNLKKVDFWRPIINKIKAFYVKG